MQKFEGISFIWALLLVACVALVYGLRAVIGYRAVAKDAESDYTYKYEQNMVDPRLSKDGYIRAYKRYNNPRSLAHVAGGLSAILLLTAPALLIIQVLLNQLYLFSGKSRVFEPGYLVWQFSIFFALIGVWAAIAYFTARRFHRGASVSFRDELLKEMDD